ncbi:IPT/TIG domain-containing protein, partial [Flavobacterium sp. 270]|uniref:beta strand repeat-containing protein n=1 Tax=Flavobacterium sp. 270 TaxID=2512114 RepID=UPI0010D7BDC0
MTKKLLLFARSLFSNSSNNNRNVVVKECFFSLKSHRVSLLLALLFVCFSFNFAGAQTTLFQFNYESGFGTNPNIDNVLGTPVFSANGVDDEGIVTSATCGGGNSRMYSADDWDIGDSYRYEVNTTGFGNMNFSFCIKTDNAAVGAFIVRVSTDSGTNWNLIGSNFTPTITASASATYSIPTLANNSAVVWIEIVKINTNANNSRTLVIDNATLTGYSIPNITSFTPTSVCAGSSASVVITGTNFTGATTVSFNGIAATSYTVNSNTQITATSPTTATTGTISVSNSNGTGTSGSSFIVNPLPTITAAASPTSVASGGTSVLTATPTPASTVNVTVLQEDFNAATNNWTTTNTSTGGTPANANWTLRPNGYTYNYPNYPINTFHSNDNSQFYLTNSADQGSAGTTRTTLQSPAINTTGLTTLSLDFYQYFLNFDGDDDCFVDVSTNGTSWTNVATYSATQGVQNNFLNTTVNLDGYVGNLTLYVRFRYAGKFDWYWAIDNVTISGTRTNSYTYSWTANPAGVTAGLPAGAGTANVANKTINVTPTQNTNYTVTVINTATGCAATASPVLVTIAAPTITSFTPTSACTGAGGSVVITGNNFNAATAVRFNGVTASFTVNSNTQITATIPVAATTGTISVTTVGGTASSSGQFTVSAIPTASAGGTQTICQNGTATVSGALSSNGTIAWTH